MKNVITGILCLTLCALAACGGSSSSNKSKSSTSAALSSAPVGNSSVPGSVASAASSSISSTGDTSSSVISLPGSSSVTSISSVESSSLASASASSVAPPVAQTGVFIDSAVAGISYVTSPGGFSGITSSTGQYQFAVGDTVIFSIGAIQFPAVAAKAVVTPLDMSATSDPADPIVVNIAVLLQSLDADGDPDNGIDIPASAAAAAVQSVNLDQPYADFAVEVLAVVQHSDSSKTVVSDTAASTHLAQSLARVNAASLIGTWYVEGVDYQYALFVLDESHYAAVDRDMSVADGSAFERGSYVWDQSTGVVTLSAVERTDSDLDAEPPMANGNTLVLNGDELTFTDADESFVAHRLTASEQSPLKGGWSLSGDGELVLFAFTDTHYLMGQYSAADEMGMPGAEIGTYTHHRETGALVVDTIADTNGQWGLSHPCAVLDLQESNDLGCGPDGRDIVQTLHVTGDTLTFISEADTLAYGEEEPVLLERVNGLPDGDTHLKLTLTLTLTEYTQGEKFVREGATMQCDLDAARTVGEMEILNESWVLGNGSDRATWLSIRPASFNPQTKVISFDLHEPLAPIPNHPGFYQEFWESFAGTYNAAEPHVITGTYTETYHLTWALDESVSICEATYSVVGELRQ